MSFILADLRREGDIRVPRQKTVQITVSRPGRYTVEGRIEEVTGTFRRCRSERCCSAGATDDVMIGA